MLPYNTSQTPLPEPFPAPDDLSARLADGGRLVGPYLLGAVISEGPTGTLFHADRRGGNSAMVRIIPRAMSSTSAIARFVERQQTLAQTLSPHFVALGAFGETEDLYYIGSDLLVGCDLATAFAASGGIHRTKAIEIARQICLALEKAHQAGIVHGALHPQNIYLVPTGNELTVKVLDFGAHALSERPGSLVILGDPAYLAPEQFYGHTTPKSDVYSLALVIYELLSGRRYCEGSAASATAQKLGAAPEPTLDPTLGALLERSLNRDPAQRPPSVLAFRRALLAWAERAGGNAEFRFGPAVTSERVASERHKRVQNSVQPVPIHSTGVQVSLSSQPMERSNMQSNGKNKLEAAPVASGASGSGGDKPATESESVEASLEEFINQANASFPTSDGWDLHTGDVELVDPEPDVEDEDDGHQAVSEVDATSVTSATEIERKRPAHTTDDLGLDAPRQASASAKTETSGKRTTQVFGTGATSAVGANARASTSMPAVQPSTEAPGPTRSSKTMPAATAPAEEEKPTLARKSTSKAMPAVADPEETSAPKRTSRSMATVDRTEVVEVPMPPAYPAPPAWTSNPLVLAACMTMAFVVGAGALFLMTRNMQPIVVQAPPATAPVAAPAPTAVPVVTPLPTNHQPVAAQPAATQPIVTPLPTTDTPQPAAAVEPAPAKNTAKTKVDAIRQKLTAKPAKAAPKSDAKIDKKSATDAKKTEPKPSKTEAKPAKEDKPAPAKKDSKPAKSGGDWVDPF